MKILYDIFGSPVAGDFTTGADYGYLGKPYDSITGLYNYGYRDYSPQVVRFTTVDPIRDGTNWFAYVNNDPVNYVDLWGLRPTYGATSRDIDEPSQEAKNMASQVELSTQIKSKGKYITTGVVEVVLGTVIIVGGSIAAATLSPTTVGVSAMVGYDAIILGSTIIAVGITRLSGANDKPIKDDIEMILVPAMGAFVTPNIQNKEIDKGD